MDTNFEKYNVIQALGASSCSYYNLDITLFNLYLLSIEKQDNANLQLLAQVAPAVRA